MFDNFLTFFYIDDNDDRIGSNIFYLPSEHRLVYSDLKIILIDHQAIIK